jgi:hypothetical protein
LIQVVDKDDSEVFELKHQLLILQMKSRPLAHALIAAGAIKFDFSIIAI